ncbi:MAG: flagellin [Candidatus Riflebacteria bacterium]|nr:flagellin [Candidatus Riflebacteria bacterium]
MNIQSTGSLPIASRLNDVTAARDRTLIQLASGKQTNSASDNPADMLASSALDSFVRSLTGQISNKQDEISLTQTAFGGMSATNDALTRINELSIQASNGTLTTSDRQAIQVEIDQLKQQIDQTANNTQYNGQNLLDGTYNATLSNGNTLKLGAMNSDTLGLKNLDVTTTGGAQAAIGSTASALENVNSQRATLSGVTGGIASEISGLTDQLIDSTASLSRITDTDMAKAATDLANAQIQAQATIQVFRIDNASRGQMLQLLGSS